MDDEGTLTGWDETEVTAGIHDAMDEVREAEKKVGKAIHLARFSGASWAAVAAALGTSKQAAWERWKDVDERNARGEFDF